MIAFINQEAKEKAEEIRVKTESDFMSEKLTLQTEASIAIREDFDKKKKDRLIAKRIEKSKALTTARYTAMRHRDEKVKFLKSAVTLRLAEIARNPQYKQLLKFLLVQGFLTIQEPDVIIQCRKEDEELVKPLIPEAIAYYQELILKETGVRLVVKATLSKTSLPPAPVAGRQGASCCGGVVLSAQGGKIICRNTLDSRLELVFHALEPQIRAILFGVRAKAVVKAPKPQAHH